MTPELSPNEMAILFSFRGKEGFMGFAQREITEEDLEIPDVKFQDESKSPGQRLRSVIYVFWEKNTKRDIPFEDFYRQYLEKIIHGIKDRL